MKGGLRLQLVLLLTLVLLISYVPLFFAVTTYTRIGLDQLQQREAARLARSALLSLGSIADGGGERRLRQLAERQVEQGSLDAVALERGGQLIWLVGPGDFRPSLEARLRDARPDDEQLPRGHSGNADVEGSNATDDAQAGASTRREVIDTARGPAWIAIAPCESGRCAVLVRLDSKLTGARKLTSLMSLYLLLAALSLAVAGYFALTRWIIRPIVVLEQSAARVATGGRRLVIPEKAPREIASLSARLSRMTEQLRQEESQLLAKIEEVESTSNELLRTQRSLVRSERLATVGRLSAGLAHEVGNPISALMGFIDLLIEGDLSPEEEQDFLRRMKKETGRIDRVLSDLLAYARPEAESRPSNPGSIREAVDSVLQLLSPQKGFRSVDVDRDLEDGDDRVALGSERLTQVLLNLVFNAADACQQQGHIRIRSRLQGDSVEVRVDDDGPGIPQASREQVFEPFYTTKDVGRGTGLGLSVTRGLLESVGGTIEIVDSDLGGAAFRVLLPRPAGSDPHA